MKYMKWVLMFLICPAVAMAGDQGGAPPPARVVTAPVIEKMVAENTKFVGVLSFDRVSRLSSEVSGLVESVHFREGDRVKKGQLLVRLKTDFIKNEIDSVLARIEQVNVRLAKAEKDLKRYDTLYRQAAVSEKEYDDMALSREDLLKQKLILEKELELARLKEKKSMIRAPFDGVVLEKKTDSGNWVLPGNELCLIGSMDDLFIKVPVPEKLFLFSKTGEQIDVTVNALGRTVTGVIDGFIPVADPQTKNIFVKVRVPQLESVALNMSATVFMPSGEKQSMVLVPRDALINSNGSRMVYTVKEGRATPVAVKVISYIGGYAGVENADISAGMPVVVDGNDRLRPDQAVDVINQG